MVLPVIATEVGSSHVPAVRFTEYPDGPMLRKANPSPLNRDSVPTTDVPDVAAAHPKELAPSNELNVAVGVWLQVPLGLSAAPAQRTVPDTAAPASKTALRNIATAYRLRCMRSLHLSARTTQRGTNGSRVQWAAHRRFAGYTF